MESVEIDHPYLPRSLQLPGFTPLRLSMTYILGVFFAASTIIIATVWLGSKKYGHLKIVERLLLCWFAISGLIHMVLEGYFVFTPDFYKKPYINYFAEVWKEYSKGDSRYAGRDPTIVIVEGITAVLAGPLCLLSLYAIVSQKPYQYTIQLAVSVGQIYGTIVYFGTVVLDAREFTAPGALYFWFYFVFMNGIWIIVPSLVVARSWQKISEAVHLSRNTQISRKKKT